MKTAPAPARVALAPILAFALPLGLWLQFGDGNLLRTVAMIAGCALVAWATARLLAGSDPPVAVAHDAPESKLPALRPYGRPAGGG